MLFDLLLTFWGKINEGGDEEMGEQENTKNKWKKEEIGGR